MYASGNDCFGSNYSHSRGVRGHRGWEQPVSRLNGILGMNMGLEIIKTTPGEKYSFKPYPAALLEIIEQGGMASYVKGHDTQQIYAECP